MTHLLVNLGWVDFDLGSSPGWWAATVATYCPSRVVEHPKSKSTQPSPKPDAPDFKASAIAEVRTGQEGTKQYGTPSNLGQG